MKINVVLWKIERWLLRHVPVACGNCGVWLFAKDAIPRWLTNGLKITLCKRCDHDLYRPFSKDAE